MLPEIIVFYGPYSIIFTRATHNGHAPWWPASATTYVGVQVVYLTNCISGRVAVTDVLNGIEKKKENLLFSGT